MNKDLALLTGLLLSDGSVYYDKSKRTWCIQFTNKEDALRNLFKDLMRDCFGQMNFSTNKCKNALSVRCFSKRIADVLHTFSPTFRTKAYGNGDYPPCVVPLQILEDKELSASFLRGYASGDGSLYINRKYSIFRIELTSYHPALRNQLAACLRILDIPCTVRKHGIFVTGQNNCQRFLDLVGFIPSRTLSN